MKTIEVSEDIGIKNIKEFYTELCDAMDQDQDIAIDLSRVQRIDLSFIQVILSAGREQSINGRNLKVQSVSEKVKNQLILAGLK